MMRVDPNQVSQSLPENVSDPISRAANSEPQSAGVLGEDQAELSSTPELQRLVSQASQLPDTRMETVNALRQAILGGNYQPGPTEISEALFAHMLAPPD